MLFSAIDDRAFHSIITSLAAYAPRASRFFFSHGKVPWTCSWVIAAIAGSGAYVNASHEATVNGSKFPDLMADLGFPLGTCFITDNTAFHKYSIEPSSVRLRVERTAYSRSGVPQEARDRRTRHRAP